MNVDGDYENTGAEGEITQMKTIPIRHNIITQTKTIPIRQTKNEITMANILSGNLEKE